jgi:uncharacterized protein (DUF2147 family)
MFYRLSAYAIAAALFPIASANAQEAFPSGVWSDAERMVVVRISPCSAGAAVFCGTVVEDNRPGPPANPPGHQFLRDLKQTRTGWKGKLNDGGTGLTLSMQPQAGGTAQVRFCLGVLCDTETWRRLSSVPAQSAPLRR